MATKVAAPSDDKRWRLVETRIRKIGRSPDSLIEALHAAQEAFSYLDTDSLTYVAEALEVPLSKVYGVATFYSFFTLKPQGEHTCVVCTGTACYITGASQLLDAIRDEFGAGAGETTSDDLLSVLDARCIGACSMAPAATIDGELVGPLTPESVVARLHELEPATGDGTTEDDAAPATANGGTA